MELEALQEHIAEFIRSVLICLSTIESEDRRSWSDSTVQTLPVLEKEDRLVEDVNR